MITGSSAISAAKKMVGNRPWIKLFTAGFKSFMKDRKGSFSDRACKASTTGDQHRQGAWR